MTSNKRKGDLVLVVCQHNAEKMLEIQAADPALEAFTGYSAKELMGVPLKKMLPDEINSTIDDYIEYEEGANDLSAVLSKVRRFRLVAKDGQHVPFHLRVFNTTSFDKNQRFLLVMRDASVYDELETAKQNTSIDLSAVTDALTGVSNTGAFGSAVNLVQKLVERGNTVASLAVFAVDGFLDFEGRYGREATNELLVEISNRAKENFREDDVIGYLGGLRFGVLLMEADPENAKIPLNRLRWLVSSRPFELQDGQKISVSMTVCFTSVVADRTPDELLHRVMDELEQVQGEMENRLIELP